VLVWASLVQFVRGFRYSELSAIDTCYGSWEIPEVCPGFSGTG